MYAHYVIYASFMTLIWFTYFSLRIRKHSNNDKVKQRVIKDGLTEPASLHPVINPNRCIGCQSCVHACPEQSHAPVLGLIRGKAELINPTECIGHGACYASCPVDAITLVFGTSKRGVDLPVVKPNFETNVPGIFVAGELGGMGLIRNAFKQGQEAVDAIEGNISTADPAADLDVLIVGAGPAGFAASLAAKQKNLKFATVEQDSLGGTIFQYPRRKVVMTEPADLPIVGKVHLKLTTKEALLEMFQSIVDETKLEISYRERVEEIRPGTAEKTGFVVKTSQNTYTTRTVLLAIGRRGTPRKLGIPGEDKPKTVYRLIDPEQYKGKNVLVVSGGDSALEAATSIAEQPDTQVTLSYRGDVFNRAKETNRKKLLQAEMDGRIKVLRKSNLKSIKDNHVVIDHENEQIEMPNDAVIICAGGELPTPFLKNVGIELQTKYGTPL